MNYNKWFGIFEAECKRINPRIRSVCKICFKEEWILWLYSECPIESAKKEIGLIINGDEYTLSEYNNFT